jgi:hypothetical protein
MKTGCGTRQAFCTMSGTHRICAPTITLADTVLANMGRCAVSNQRFGKDFGAAPRPKGLGSRSPARPAVGRAAEPLPNSSVSALPGCDRSAKGHALCAMMTVRDDDAAPSGLTRKQAPTCFPSPPPARVNGGSGKQV